jgi:hypothetical protein
MRRAQRIETEGTIGKIAPGLQQAVAEMDTGGNPLYPLAGRSQERKKQEKEKKRFGPYVYSSGYQFVQGWILGMGSGVFLERKREPNIFRGSA